MFICGNDDVAKATVIGIRDSWNLCASFGWSTPCARKATPTLSNYSGSNA
jgi:hypothetical protein